MNDWMKQLKDYWFLIVFIFGGVAAIVKILGNDYVGTIADTTIKNDATKLYIKELVQTELDSAKPITELQGRATLHESEIEQTKGTVALTQSQLQDVARILMQPPD